MTRRPSPRSPRVEKLLTLAHAVKTARDPREHPLSPEDRQAQSRKRRRRLLRRMLTAVVLLVVVDGVWITTHAFAARGHLLRARTLVSQAQDQVRQGHLQQALALAAKVKKEASAADRDADDPAWNLTASLPIVGPTLTNIAGLASAVDDVAGQIIPELASAATDVRGGRLRLPDGSINVASLTAAGHNFAHADTALKASQSRVAGLPTRFVIAQVAQARQQLLSELAGLRNEFTGATVATGLAPGMLGADGPRTYFLALENTAESRGTGGIIGGFGIAQIDNGKLSLLRAGGDGDLPAYSEPSVELPPDDVQRWGAFNPSADWRNANISPHFPWAVDSLAALYTRHFGGTVDGVIALDPTAAGYILDATGPVTLPDGTVLTGSTLTDYVESKIYADYDVSDVDVAKKMRQTQLKQVTTAIFGALIAGQGDPTALLAALGRADSEGRLTIGSTHREEEQEITSTLVGGELPDSGAPFSQLLVVNASGDKLDYYLDRSVSWVAGDCSGATRTSTVSATLTNNAPASGLPAYVSGAQTVSMLDSGETVVRGDARSPLPPPYTLREFASVYGTSGATVTGVAIDGREVNYVLQSERGHPVVSVYVNLPAGGGHSAIEVHWKEPTAPGAPQLRVQPLVHPQTSSVEVRQCP